MWFAKTDKARAEGFTLVEMMIIAPIVVLAIGAFLAVIISMTGEVIASRTSNTISYNIQDALNRIEQDVKQSATFLPQTAVETGSSQGYNDDMTNFTNVGGTSGTSLILNMIATNGNPLSISSQYVFLKNQPNDCSNSASNIPLTYRIVYFVKDSTLWRRTIMPSNYGDTSNYACAVPWQQPSCSPAYMAAQTGSVFCKTNDTRLVDNISSDGFAITYFSGSAASAPNTVASSPSSSATERGQALTSVSSIKATIAVQQLAGGRDVSGSGDVRVSRLATNASAIASLTPTTAPTTAPTVSSKTEPGAKATFTWGAVQGATSYNVDYNIDGGAWQTGATNLTDRSYTVTAPSNNRTVNLRIQAANSAGTTGYSTASATIPLWEPLLVTKGWVSYGNDYSTPAYTKTKGGAVIFKGMIKRSAAATNETIAVVPEGYRPQGGRLIFGTTTNSNVTGRVDVASGGEIVTVSADAGWLSLESIRYVANDGSNPAIETAPVNGWTNYGSGYAPAAYTIVDTYRVFTQGLVNPGTLTSNTRIVSLPTANAMPQAYSHVASRGTGFAFVGVSDRAGYYGIATNNTGSGYLSLNTNYINSQYSGWITPALSGGWVAYDAAAFTTPQYTKTSDGLVTLKGLIKGGPTTAGNTIFTLPAGYRPKERILTTTVSNVAHARIDILPGGTVAWMTGSNAWYSLDGITFMAEQ